MDEQNHWKWLVNKIPSWVEKGVLNPDQAERLLKEQPPFQPKQGLLTRILIGISALLFGLGVISFFAYNWEDMPKWLKLAIIFISFVTVHLTGLKLGQNPSKKILSEFFHLVGTFFFGAAIMLIAQIYHIEEHAPNGVLLWSLGAMLMVYILNSTPQMLLYGVLTVVWQFMEIKYAVPQLWAILLTGAVVIPFAIHKKNRFATGIATVTLFIVISIQLRFFNIGIFGNLFFLSVLCIGTGLLIRRTPYTSSAAPPEWVGYTLYFFSLIALTFSNGIKEGLIKSPLNSIYLATSSLWLPSLIALVTLSIWFFLYISFKKNLPRYQGFHDKLFLFIFVSFLWGLFLWSISKTGIPLDLQNKLPLIGMIGFNIIASIQGIILIFFGTRSGQVGISFLGCLLLVIIILSRFADYSDDLLMRSASFTLAGAFILWIALKTSKVKQQRIQNV